MNQQTKLATEVQKWEWMRPHLESLEFDAVAMMMALESETNVKECLLELGESAREDDLMVEAVEKRIKELQARKSRLEVRADKKRKVIGATLRNLRRDLSKPVPSVSGPNMTLIYRAGTRDVIITDQSKLPKQYLRIIPEEEKVDMRSLRSALERNETVEGAMLGNGGEPACNILVK